MASRSERKAGARPENLRKAFHLAWNDGDHAAAALLAAKRRQCPQLRLTIEQAFDEVAGVRLDPKALQLGYIAAWNGLGESGAKAKMEEDAKRCPPCAKVYGNVFAEVKRIAGLVHA